MNDNDIIKALEGSILNAKRIDCKAWSVEVYKLGNALDLINRLKRESNSYRNKAHTQKGELARLNKQVAEQKAEIEKLEIELKAMRGAANSYKAEVERFKGLQKDGFFNLLGNCLVYSKNLKDYNDMRKGLKSEAIKEFAEMLCDGRVSNDPVVIAVKTELKMTEGKVI